MHLEVDFVDLLNNVVHFIREVLYLCQLEFAFHLLDLLVTATFHHFLLLLDLGLVCISLLGLLELFNSFFLLGLLLNSILLGIQEHVLLHEVLLSLPSGQFHHGSRPSLEDVEVCNLWRLRVTLLRLNGVVVRVVVHAFGLQHVPVSPHLLIVPDLLHLSLGFRLLFIRLSLQLGCFILLLFLAFLSIFLIGVPSAILSFNRILILLGVVSLLLSHFYLGLDGNLLQITLAELVGQVREIDRRFVRIQPEPLGHCISFYDVGGPDQEQGGALGVNLDVFRGEHCIGLLNEDLLGPQDILSLETAKVASLAHTRLLQFDDQTGFTEEVSRCGPTERLEASQGAHYPHSHLHEDIGLSHGPQFEYLGLADFS